MYNAKPVLEALVQSFPTFASPKLSVVLVDRLWKYEWELSHVRQVLVELAHSFYQNTDESYQKKIMQRHNGATEYVFSLAVMSGLDITIFDFKSYPTLIALFEGHTERDDIFKGLSDKAFQNFYKLDDIQPLIQARSKLVRYDGHLKKATRTLIANDRQDDTESLSRLQALADKAEAQFIALTSGARYVSSASITAIKKDHLFGHTTKLLNSNFDVLVYRVNNSDYRAYISSPESIDHDVPFNEKANGNCLQCNPAITIKETTLTGLKASLHSTLMIGADLLKAGVSYSDILSGDLETLETLRKNQALKMSIDPAGRALFLASLHS